MKKWFESSTCEKMKVIEYKSASDKSILREIVFEDADYTGSFKIQISQLPATGEMMIKMGPDAKKLVIEFTCGAKTELVEFFNERIKTPDTSFYSKANHHEQAVWSELQALLKKPVLGQAVPKAKNLELKFEKFSLRYLGSEDRTPQGTTATSYVETFKVKNMADQSEKLIEVHSGQSPPEDVDFQLGSGKYVLRTFKSKKGESLYPRQIIIDRQ